MDDNIKKLHQALIDDGYDDVGTEQEFRDYVSDSKNVATLYNALSEAGYDNFKDQKSLETYLSSKAPVAQKPSTPQSSGQSVSSQKKEQVEYPQEVLDAFNSPNNKPGNFKDLAQLNDEYQRGVLKKPGIISQALGMMPKVDAGNIGKEQKMGGMIANLLLGDNMQQSQDNNQQVQHPNQENAPATEQPKPTVKDVDAITGAAPVQQVDAIYNKYVGKGDALSETMYDLMASGQAQNQEEAQNMAMGAMNRAASRLAQRTTDEFVSKLGDTVEGVDEAVMNGWHSHAVQDKLKKLASQYGIMNSVAVDENGQYITQTNGYDQFINGMVKPAMVESLVKKYGENYRKAAEDLATRLYSNDEVIQNQLMNQDIDEALSSVISKYVNPSVVEEYNKAQEEGSKAFAEGMEGSQFIPANLRLGTALGAQYEANQVKDPQKILSRLMVMNYNMLSDPKFRLNLAEAATNVALKYHRYGEYKLDPDRINGLVLATVKNKLDQLEIKGMMPKGSAEYIMKTGLGNTIVGKITRKIMQTDYQNWLEDIANQQYQPGFWENVASGALTFAGDAWSYWLPGAAGGKLTKSMVAKAEGKLAGDLMAKGMERKMAERAAKVLIGKSKAAALKGGAAHGAVTFGGQSAISKPIDEVYRTGQFDENGKIYNPSVGKVIANTLGEVAKQSAVGAIMQGGTIANMVGKGRGLATNILADIGGKVADSSIMTGQQILERMAHDPNFKPTGKDAAESFLESMANLTAIGLPGMVGKYARFKDAREFNKKFDFTDQDIAELKRFGYEDLRDAFEKVGIGEYAVVGENAQRLDGQLPQKYMDLMNDKSVPEVLKAKMMAVVEGKRPSSFSPIVDSIIVQPMDNDGKVYLETLNKDGGVVDRKEYSSLDEAQKADKKLEYEKTLGLASVLEGEFHNEFTQEHLDGLYNKAAQKYNMGEKLTDEDKAAVYLHQNAGAIKEIMDKQQKGVILTDEEQKQVNAYRHYYDNALENSSVMREFVNTFEDSHGVARGTLRKALESKDKKYAPLVESYLKELYNSIELKREMKQTMDDLYNTSHGNEQKRIEQSGIEGEKPSAPVEGAAPIEGSAGGQEPPVSAGPAPYQDRTNSVPSPSDANSAANVENSSAEVAASDAFVMGQNAYKNGDSETLQAIGYNSDLATGRLKRAFADNEKMPDIVANAYNEGRDMEQFVAQRASLTPAQKDAISKYVEAMDAKKGVIDALQHADDGYGDSLKEQLWPYQTEDGNIVPATLDSGKQVFLKKDNEYGGAFVVVPDEQGKPTIKQIPKAGIIEKGTPIPLDEYIEKAVALQKDARNKQFISQFDGSRFKRGDIVSVSMEEGDKPSDVKIVGYTEDGRVILTDTDVDVNSQIDPDKLEIVTKDKFNAWRQNAIDSSVGAELDAEDAQRANDDAAKAEAEKKQRFTKGIVGLSDQKPDYSSKDTDANVAAEYLQELYADNHDRLVKLVNGSRSDIKEQIDNIRKRIVEAEDWLDTNADLEPEQAQSREDKLKLAKEQLEDLTNRYDNWNKIRSLIMTDEEKRDLKDERTANIKKVGIDKEALTVTDEREVPVLTDEELKKQYPTMDEASDYILSQRKEISKTQEELHRQLLDIDARLNQYLSGENDLTDEEIRDFNTTKADLEARMANLTESAKELKAQADKLKKLYVQENKKKRAAILAEMTPAEQRRVKAEQYLNDGNISGLMKLYADTSVDFTDDHPYTVDEYVASSIGRHALNYEGREVNGTFLNGLQQEFGGTRKDLEKIQVLAAEGKGQTFDKYVNGLYDNLPDNLRNQGVNTQEIRNSLLALLRGAEKYTDLKNYILKEKIAQAEGEMRSMDLAEEEQRAAYEEEKILQMQEQVDDVSEKYSLSSETAGNGEQFYQDAEGNIDLASVPQEVFEQIGYTAAPFRLTPKMIKHMMDRHNTELKFSSPDEAIDFVCDVMNNFDHVRLGYDGALVFSIEDGRRRTGKRAVTILINNDNGKFYGLKTSGYESVKGLEKRPLLWERGANEKTSSTDAATASVPTSKSSLSSEQSGSASHQGNDLNLKGASTSNSSDNHLAEHPNGVPDLLPTQENDVLSDGKDTNNSDNLQGKNKKFSEKLQNAIAETDSEPTEAQKKAGNYKKGHLTFGGYNFTLETPKGTTRSGKDEQGKPWSVTMHDTYGYILGKIGVDGDHIDMFINDAADLDTFDGNVYVVDQVNPETGEFDEHKVLYGYPSEEAATEAYLANYSKGWKGLGKVTSVPKATFDKWLESSDRKTKPFAEYAMIQQEEAKKANEALPFDAPMSMDALPFHRDVKEVKPENMTEAQKVAYDAVSTMLKKAGIPVKVVSNEDMEKVAEAQDNLAVEMLLNDPRLRFYIKTPEQKEAAKAAYDWAAKNRPDKFKQYAIVNMDNPNQPPQYFEKKDLAEKWRKYYTNAWKIGNYKAFNLNKPFEEQIKDIKGDVPSEFDPYKAESLLNKRIELEKQIKETEDSYNAKKKERAEYQNQLMQDYMDQHGLSSENDIPDDVWTDYRDKSFEKYQDTLDDLFHKYVELDNQLKAVAEPGVQYLKGKGVVYGYTDGKQIVLNQEHLNPNTPIHEYQHLWRTAAKKMNPELIEHGDKLIMQTQLFADLKKDPNYNHLTDEQICDEAFARLTGEDGAAILEQMAKDAIKENPLDTAKELSVINKLKEWLKKFWYWTLDTFTKWKPEDIKKMTLEDIRNLVLRDLANGVDPRIKLHEAENADDIKFMGSTTKKRMKDISTQLEGRELDEAQQAVADVYSGKKDNVSLTVEREDGSNKIIMRQGNDNHAGTKHSVFRHYGVKANSVNVNDLLLIPTVLKEGERKVSDNGRVAYVYVDPTSQVKYTVVTEPKNNKEFFNDFYSNKKANPSETSRVVENSTNTPEGAHNNDGNAFTAPSDASHVAEDNTYTPEGARKTDGNTFMAAKVDNNSETAKENDENLSVEDKIKAVSQQFGVDQADVAMYANAIKKGSTAEAARARANIKRHLLQANEDKISSFKELLKYTVPVNEALKENFGDVDAMIEERKQQMEAQRNAMEAARKRAEEEEAKRQKHLEELSLIPDDQLDKQYMDALAKGDDATAREMLDEAARRKGYDDTESSYQGVGAWAAPGNPGYESDKARRDDWESSGSDVNLEDIALGYTPQPDDYFSHPERYSQNTPHGLESVKAINAAIDAIKNGEEDVKVKVYRAVPTSVKEGKLRNGDWVTPSKKYADMHGANRLEGKYRIIEDEVSATQLWWDGNDANEFGFDDGKEYKYKNAKNNRKLNDLVTYDDEGDVIPPSKRFNSRKQDVRFMFAGENDGAHYSKVYGKKANVMPRLGSATIGLKAAKDKVVELFNKAKSGEFNGKPQSIGTLTQEGKKFLEDLSGLKMKDKIDFVLNPSDLKHMNKDHFGDNEKDPGRNIPLTEEDLRSMVDVIMNPEQVVYGIEKMDNRKAFFFLKQAEDGTLNLAEIYSDKKGNLTAKSYYKTKKGVDQRVMEIKNSLLPTPEASSGSPLSDGKGINFFSIEQEKTAETAENERKIADSVVNTANKLGGAEATVYSSLDDVPEEYRSEVEQGAKGWYDPETHTVHVYLPNCEDGNDAQRTVFHEKIGHEGMEVLLGGEDGVRKFANFVYNSVAASTRGKILDIANKYDPDWQNPDRMNVGTQEYIAHLAEEGPKTAEDFSLWTKIKHYLIKLLKKLGVRVPGLLNDKDLRYYLMKSGKALHVWDEMPETQQDAMMKQASNAEIKDALSDGAGKGKPQRKKGEGEIAYIKRRKEWEKWKNAREDKEDPEPPMFYDFDKDAEGKKEWERLNKEWRDEHHLQGDEMPIKPERKEGETDEEFFPRYKEWEKWNDAMTDKENPMPDMFSFEKAKQDEVRKNYEKWLTRHELIEQNNADLDLYEGKIYSEQDLMNGRLLHPAETSPEAAALDQQIMQDLAEVTSSDVSKEGAARSVHDAVIYRRKNIESASADDAIFINSVKQELNKMANASYLGRKADAIADVVKETVTGKTPKTQAKRMAEAIPYIIEAPRRMRDIANELNAVGAFENGHIHVTAEDVDAIQPFTEELRDLAANSHKVEKNGKETIVYDDVPSMTEVASKMAKAINENHKGEEGFVPIDGTDILAEHVLPVVLKRIVPKGIEYKNLSEEMQSLLGKIREWYDKTFTWLKDSHTVRDDIGYTADYVNHRWDKEKSDDKAYADLVEGRQRTKSPNEKPRKVSTYMEGVDAGLVPKTTDITDLLAYYSQSNIEAFANKTFLQELSGINVIERNKDGEITSSMPLLSSIQPKEMMVDENKYTPYVVPGINTVWVYNQGKIFNKSAEDWFNAAFGTVKIPKVLKGVKNAMSIAKTLELGFSGFHAGALTEVYAVQNSAEFGPAKAMAYFMKYLITDTAKTHQLPAFANPEAFKEAAKHLVKFGSASDYATADIENLYEKVHSYVARLHSKLVEGNVAMKAGSSVTFPLEVATELLRMSQKGLDVALWSYLHDGLKLATYQLRAERTRERAKKLDWDADMLNKALDEDGQFVNDMFGGQHFDVLGISKKMQTILDFIFLSKDWLISTTRHALSIFGYGSIWNEASIKNFWEYYKHVLGRGEMTKEDYLRLSRSKSGLLCYGVGFMIGYEGLSQLVNAAMRAWDEEKQKEKADEIRKINPSYKSPYELAYPDGMHWYDYLMRGNSLGQQSKIFMGRYADGTEMYIRHGKQFREIPELFFDAKDNFAIPGPMVRRMYGKSSPLLRGMIDTYKWYLSPDYGDKEMQRKYGENLGLIPKLASYYIPFDVPTQKDKEFKMLDLVFPSSKGFSRYKAQDYFKTFIMSEDKQGLAMTYNACVQNGIDPEEQLKAAISSVKALEASEMQDGVTSLQEASKRFDAAKSITEKKKMRQKMKKFLSQSDYKAFTQKEALDMVQGYLNGDEDLKEMEKAESKYLMKAKAEDVTEDWRIQNVWNGTMETYQEYQRLKDIDKAKANAFKNSKTNKRLFAARKAISAARRKMNKAKKQMDGTNDAAKLVEIRKTRKELLKTLNGME